MQVLADNDVGTELLVRLWSHSGNVSHALYDSFSLSDDGNFALILGNYSGDAGDGLDHSRGMVFSTHDRDRDGSAAGNCAEFFSGAWW